MYKYLFVIQVDIISLLCDRSLNEISSTDKNPWLQFSLEVNDDGKDEVVKNCVEIVKSYKVTIIGGGEIISIVCRHLLFPSSFFLKRFPQVF